MSFPTTHSISTRFNPPLVDGEPSKEEGQLEEESEDDADSSEKTVGSQRGKDGGSSDEEDDDVGRTGHCDPNPCFPHRSSNSFWKRNIRLWRLILPGVDQHKHVVDAQPDEEAEDEGMHGTIVKAEG